MKNNNTLNKKIYYDFINKNMFSGLLFISKNYNEKFTEVENKVGHSNCVTY